jgi:hypothetical protein
MDFITFDYLGFVEDFHCEGLVCWSEYGEFDFAKSALADCFIEGVVCEGEIWGGLLICFFYGKYKRHVIYILLLSI